MAEYEYGTGSAFLNWFIKRQTAGRAVIAASEADYQRQVTDIRAQLSIRDAQRYMNENVAAVAQFATQHGMDVPTYGQFLLKKADAQFAAMLKSYERYLDYWHGGRMNAQAIQLEEARSRLKLSETRELNLLEAAKDVARGVTEVRIAGETTIQTIEATERYNESPHVQQDKLLARAGKLRQQIEDTLAMAGKSEAWRQGQAEVLRKTLAKVEKQIEEL